MNEVNESPGRRIWPGLSFCSAVLEEHAVEHGEDDLLLGLGEAAQAFELARQLDALQTTPRPHGCKKLRGTTDLWQVRVGGLPHHLLRRRPHAGNRGAGDPGSQGRRLWLSVRRSRQRSRART